MILEIEPGEDGLKGSIGTTPAVVVERLITIMIILIYSFCIVLKIFIFRLCLDKHVRIKYLLRDQRNLLLGCYYRLFDDFRQEVTRNIVYHFCQFFL